MQRIRRELAAILQHGTSATLPEGFADAGRDLSAADQPLLLIWSRVFDDDAMRDLRQMLVDSPRTAVDIALDELPAAADRATRRRLGEQYAPVFAAMVEKYRWLNASGSRGARERLLRRGDRRRVRRLALQRRPARGALSRQPDQHRFPRRAGRPRSRAAP